MLVTVMVDCSRRLIKLYDYMKQEQLDAVIVGNGKNRRYFSGFSGSTAKLLITRRELRLFTDFRYVEQARAEAKSYDVIDCNKPLEEAVGEAVKDGGFKTVGFEGEYVSYHEYSVLAEQLDGCGCQLKSVSLDLLREIKDENEVAEIEVAVAIADKAFEHVLTVVRPGMSEMAVAAALEYSMKQQGSEKPAFDTIVASGWRGSLPHGLATNKLIVEGDFVTMDFGAVYHGYHSDITRTFCVGRASDKQREVYDIVLAAQQIGVAAVAVGESGVAVDTAARKYIVDKGYGKYFGHGLGHGVGLAIHEQPRLSPSSKTERLLPGMVVTVEPGVYIPDWGGVRIEDTVLVTAGGAKVLTASGKQLIEIY